jgi:8-oxo-dGTP diphosphatase
VIALKVIHKIAAVVIRNNEFLMVRKHGKDVWTSLGGKPEEGESEEQALLREVREEVGCEPEVVRKLGDFEAKAVFDDALVRLSAYLVRLKGEPVLQDPELEEFRFLPKDYKAQGIKLPPSIEEQVIPHCVREGLLDW